MNVASLELCRELYKLSRWSHFPDVNDLYYVVSNENELDNYVATWHELREAPETYWCTSYKTPAYDLGYLLRKLPRWIVVQLVSTQWRAALDEADSMDGQRHQLFADTPEDAAAQLCIQLFKQGVLNKKEDK